MTNAVANPWRGKKKSGFYEDQFFKPYPMEDLWFRVNNLQKRYMAKPWLTKKEFFAESEKEQEEYYRFLYKQAGYHADILELTPPKRTRKRNPCTTPKRNPCTPEAKARAVMAKMAPANYPQRRSNPDLSHEAAELMIYAENSEPLYNQRRDITKNLIRKLNRGAYDPKLAPKLWKYWFDNAAKGYTREHDVPRTGRGGAFGIFTPAIRREAAESMAKQELKLILAGEYEWILPSKKMPPWPHKKPRKKPHLRLVPKKKNPRMPGGGGRKTWPRHGYRGYVIAALHKGRTVYWNGRGYSPTVWGSHFDAAVVHLKKTGEYIAQKSKRRAVVAPVMMAQTEIGEALRKRG